VNLAVLPANRVAQIHAPSQLKRIPVILKHSLHA
jgi:hypothetical protein